MANRNKLSTWIPIVMVLIGMIIGAGAWAVAEHDKVDAQCEARVLRSEDRLSNSVERIERKLDWIIEQMIE